MEKLLSARTYPQFLAAANPHTSAPFDVASLPVGGFKISEFTTVAELRNLVFTSVHILNYASLLFTVAAAGTRQLRARGERGMEAWDIYGLLMVILRIRNFIREEAAAYREEPAQREAAAGNDVDIDEGGNGDQNHGNDQDQDRGDDQADIDVEITTHGA
ncbi:unnamed protein product [Parajaminaea phylloscopi]